MPKKAALTIDKKRKIIEMRGRGYTQQEIAKTIVCSPSTVSKYLQSVRIISVSEEKEALKTAEDFKLEMPETEKDIEIRELKAKYQKAREMIDKLTKRLIERELEDV